uniref:Hexosyltransferase n=1 Tax=Oryza meridionalis TaxID=40149 RepID=A0A0E0ET95_9ORYZ
MVAVARGRRCRGVVLLLLLASVLAPLVLYGGSPVSVSTLPDSTMASGVLDREGEYNLVVAASDVSLAKDLTIERVGEHKNRVLSATEDWQVVEAASKNTAFEKPDASVSRKDPGSGDANVVVTEGNGGAQSGRDSVTREVVRRDRGANGFTQPGEIDGGDPRDGEMVDRVKFDVSVEEQNDGAGETGVNNIAGTHTSGNLNSSLEKDRITGRLSEQVTKAIPKESYTPTTNSNSALPTTSGSAGHSTTSPDTTIHIIKDQLTRAKTYLSLVASRGNHGFARELHARMRDIQRVLGDATSGGQLPQNVLSKIRAMEQTLGKVKRIHDSCSGALNRLRATLRSTEERLQSHKKETNYLAQVAAKSLPKGLHCLPLRLTNEYYYTNSNNKKFPHIEKLEDPKLYHYALFSDNVLAAAVVVNSTIIHAKKPADHVFHIVTDRLNYAAMKMWFLANPLGEAAIQVQNIEEFTWLNSTYSPVMKQLESQSMIDYYFKSGQARRDENPKFWNPKYLSMLNHLRFYLPEIFPKLSKVLFLDDDTVVQHDLSAIWSIDLKGKVNGAVETCGETFHRFDKYLNFSNPLIASNFDPRACGWAYGMNVFDLSEWRRQKITDVYHNWQRLNENRLLWKLGTLPAGLVTFWNRTFPLHHSWHQLGLGYNPNINEKDIRRASVIHYNGNLKPWLEIGFARYRKYWSKYVDFDQVFLRDCNINP